MKVLKYHALDSTCSINSIAINSNEQWIAFGDLEGKISLFNYQSLLWLFSAQAPIESLPRNIKYSILQTTSIPKLTLDYHGEQITSLKFPSTLPNLLFSASQDKNIVVWKINWQAFSSERATVIRIKSEITEIKFYPKDEYLFVSCFDSFIYILKCDFQNVQFNTVCTVNSHDNIVNSIAWDPFIETSGQFISLSDQGRLILNVFDKTNNLVTMKYNYEDFINEKHTCNIITKKIDWSADGKWVVSVDHHQIKKHNIIHARLIHRDSMKESQILIGHDSPVWLAKFSTCWYTNIQDNSNFMICATGDRNGNLILWKVLENSFKVLVEFSNYGESNITDLCWSWNGEFLFTVTSSGSVCVVQLTDFIIKIHNSNFPLNNSIGGSTAPVANNTNNSNIIINSDNFNHHQTTSVNSVTGKKVIKPQLMSQTKSLVDDNSIPNIYSAIAINPVQSNSTLIPKDNMTSSLEHSKINLNKSCDRCLRQCYKVIENQIIDLPIPWIPSASNTNDKLTLTYENNPFENYCTIKLSFPKSKITVYQKKYFNRMIKIFTHSSHFYAVYDTNFTLTVYSLLNTIWINKMYFEEISWMSTHSYYIWLLTTRNRWIIYNVKTKDKFLDEYWNIDSDEWNVFQTKIDFIDFVTFDTIIIRANRCNPYKNTNEHICLVFDTNSHSLMWLNNEWGNHEIEALKKEEPNAFYNEYFKKWDWIRLGKIKEDEFYSKLSRIEALNEKIFLCDLWKDVQGWRERIKDMFMEVLKDDDAFMFVIDDFIEWKSGWYSDDLQRIKEDVIAEARGVNYVTLDKKNNVEEDNVMLNTNEDIKPQVKPIENNTQNSNDIEVVINIDNKETEINKESQLNAPDKHSPSMVNDTNTNALPNQNNIEEEQNDINMNTNKPNDNQENKDMDLEKDINMNTNKPNDNQENKNMDLERDINMNTNKPNDNQENKNMDLD